MLSFCTVVMVLVNEKPKISIFCSISPLSPLPLIANTTRFINL